MPSFQCFFSEIVFELLEAHRVKKTPKHCVLGFFLIPAYKKVFSNLSDYAIEDNAKTDEYPVN